MKQITISLFLMLAVIGCKINQHTKDSFKIVGFYKGNLDDVTLYNYNQLTHIIFCFVHLDGNKIAFKDSTDEKILLKLVDQKKQYPKLKVMISFGGWGGCETCSAIFNNPEDRRQFVISVKDFLVKYNADGIDIDWESPVIGGFKDHPASPADKQNFTLMMKELRNTLPSHSEISFDANSFPEFVDNSVEWEKVIPEVNFVNLMTYGLPNDRPKCTGHHTALYSSSFQKESIQSGMHLMDSLKVPHQKIVIGAAFYGFVVQEVDSINHGLGQTGKNKNAPYFKDILEKYSGKNGYTEYWDSTAMAPFLYNPVERTFITYDNKKSCQLKTQYALDQKLGGIMFWRINGDLPENGLLDTIYKTAKPRIK